MSDQVKAVIYSRISSNVQLKGDGINSQITRCAEFAKHKNYDVLEVFKDEGVSGGLIERPGMQAMVKFLRANKSKKLLW